MILGIVQARMCSSRCPGKVMREVLGRPLIGYLLERLSYSKMINKVILATSINPADDKLCDYVKSEGYDIFRGSENDVLERFYLAAKHYNASIIVRVTADCPCVDTAVCDKLILAFQAQNADYADLSLDYAEGADCAVLSFSALEQSYKHATLKSEREHVSQYINNHLESFKKILLPNKTNDSKYRITVDEEEDFFVVKAIFEALYRKGQPLFSLDGIKRFLDAHPEIVRLNKHIVRNEGLKISLENDCILKSAE